MLRFAAEPRAALRRALLRRGHTLAELLAQVMAGKRPPSLAAMLVAKPGKRADEVLREALAHVDKLRARIDADDDSYGRCTICDVDLGEAALLEVPWADRCHAHA